MPTLPLLRAFVALALVVVAACADSSTTSTTAPPASSSTTTVTPPTSTTSSTTGPASSTTLPPLPATPNVILILSDDQGWTDYGFMGHPIVQTPNLDRLAVESTMFPYGFTTASLCTPSHRNLLTGLNWRQWISAYGGAVAVNPDPELMPLLDPLPALLAEKGYASFQGGKYWDGPYTSAGFSHGTKESSDGYGEEAQFGRESIGALFDFLDERADDPFFVYFAPELPHVPHDAPQRYLDLYADDELTPFAQGYYANVTRFDDRVGELLEYLDDNDLRKDTLLVFLTDNGFEVHPDSEPQAFGGDHGKLSMYELGFRTPILFSWPGVVPQGAVNRQLASASDIYVTILSLAGIGSPDGRLGVDLTPVLTSGADIERSSIIEEMIVLRTPPGSDDPISTGRAYLYRDSEWKYIWFARPDVQELYAIDTDPFEKADVVGEYPALAAQFRSAIESWIHNLPTLGPPPEIVPLPPCLESTAGEWTADMIEPAGG